MIGIYTNRSICEQYPLQKVKVAVQIFFRMKTYLTLFETKKFGTSIELEKLGDELKKHVTVQI